MDLTGKIIQTLTPRSGVSKKGAQWAAQDFVLDITPEDTTGAKYTRSQRIVFTVFGADKLAEMHIAAGEVVTVSVDFDAREYDGRWFNSVRAWRVQRKGDPEPVARVAPTQVETRQAQVQATPQAQGNANLFGGLQDVRAAAVRNEPQTDDLPF